MINIARHQLSNGLRVVHSKNAASGMVAVNLLYKAGSRNEQYEHTGLAHLVEHLMFGGSEAVKNFDHVMQEAGGENNAWTSNDITNYYELLPVQNIETALWVEADRMRNLLLTDKSVEVQRNVVCEEFKQRCLNTPYGDSGHLLRGMVYRIHPYRWPVIGKALSDIEQMPKEVIQSFYEQYYVPENAILSIVGNIDSDKAFSLVEKWFGDLSNETAKQSRFIPEEPKQCESREFRVVKDVPRDMLVMAFRMCGRCGGSYEACDLISDILSNGRSSRMFRNIYAKGTLVSSIDASISGDLDSGMFIIKSQLLPGVGFQAVERAIREETDRLISEGVGNWELEKTLNRFESNQLFANLNNEERASNLAYYEMLGDANLINSEVGKYRGITSRRISEVAARLFADDNCSTLYYESSSRS